MSKYNKGDSDDEMTTVNTNATKRKTVVDDDDDGSDVEVKSSKSHKKQKPNDYKDKSEKASLPASKMVDSEGSDSDDDDNNNKKVKANKNDSDDDDDNDDRSDKEDDDSIRVAGISSTIANELHNAIMAKLDERYLAAVYQPQRYDHTPPEWYQPTFMPTSTQPHVTSKGDSWRILCMNEHGSIVSRSMPHGQGTTFSLSLNTGKRISTLTDQEKEHDFTMATLDQHGVVYAAQAVYDGDNKKKKRRQNNAELGKLIAPARITYKCIFDEDRKTGFTILLPEGEDVVAVALNRDCVVIATSLNFIRFFDFTGLEIDVSTVPGNIISMTANIGFLAVYYHDEVLQHGCGFKLYDTSSGVVLYEARASITPNAYLNWCYVSPQGINYIGDSAGWIRQFSAARGFDWKVLGQTSSYAHDKQHHVWPVYIDHVLQPDDTYGQKLYYLECYKKKEPTPAATLPALKSVFVKIPLVAVLNSKNNTEQEKKNILAMENVVRERLIWDEYTLTQNTQNDAAKLKTTRATDAPWMMLGLSCAQKGLTTKAIYAAKQLRDVAILRKYLEKVNTMSHLPDLDNVMKQLQDVLREKQALQKLKVFPYNEPLEYIAKLKHVQYTAKNSTDAGKPQIIAQKVESDNPFNTPSKSLMRGKTENKEDHSNNDEVQTSTTINPFRKSTTSGSSLFK